MTKWCTVVSFLMLWKVWILENGELRCLCQEPGNRMGLLPGHCCCDADEAWWDLPFLTSICHFWHLATCHTGHLLPPINPGTLRPTGEKRLWRDWAICSFALSQSFHGLGWMWGMLSKSTGNGGKICDHFFDHQQGTYLTYQTSQPQRTPNAWLLIAYCTVVCCILL